MYIEYIPVVHDLHTYTCVIRQVKDGSFASILQVPFMSLPIKTPLPFPKINTILNSNTIQ